MSEDIYNRKVHLRLTFQDYGSWTFLVRFMDQGDTFTLVSLRAVCLPGLWPALFLPTAGTLRALPGPFVLCCRSPSRTCA